MFRFSIREMLLLMVVVAVAVGWAADRWRRNRGESPPEAEQSDLARVRVIIEKGWLDSRCQIEFVIEDRDLIQRLVGRPLQSAWREPGNVTYMVLGHMVLEDSQGGMWRIIMFHPIGHVRYGDVYYHADFAQLKDYLLAAAARLDAKVFGEAEPVPPHHPAGMNWSVD